jgi:hypothetical protein
MASCLPQQCPTRSSPLFESLNMFVPTTLVARGVAHTVAPKDKKFSARLFWGLFAAPRLPLLQPAELKNMSRLEGILHKTCGVLYNGLF